MLLGENLGGSHERPLVTALDPGEKRAERHDRLAGADIALEQPVHRKRPCEVALDLVHRVSLGLGQLEAEPVAELGDQIAGSAL